MTGALGPFSYVVFNNYKRSSLLLTNHNDGGSSFKTPTKAFDVQPLPFVEVETSVSGVGSSGVGGVSLAVALCPRRHV
jgi:hypothetical protein